MCCLPVVCWFLVFATAGAVAAAPGTLFFGGWYGNGIGRMGFDGSDLDPALISGAVDEPLVNPSAMAVNGDYLYWGDNASPIMIGRIRLDGSEARPTFIFRAHADREAIFGEGLSVSDGKLYWTESVKDAADSYSLDLSRANLDGSDIESDILTLNPQVTQTIAVSHGFVYFTYTEPGWVDIGRVRLDGSGYRPRLIRPHKAVGPVVLGGTRLYWLEGDPRHTYIDQVRTTGGRVHRSPLRKPEEGCEYSGAASSHSYLFVACYYAGISASWIDRISIFGRHRVTEFHPNANLGGGGMVLAAPES